MDDSESARNLDLSQIGTIWSMIYSAHQGSSETVSRAQRELMERYSGAVYRYLVAALRDRHAADDLFQEFALRFVRGAFRNASPERGRFRDFVKTSLYHLIVDHHQRKNRGPRPMPVEEAGVEPAVTDPQDFDAEFLQSWRQEILCRAWEGLAQASREGAPFYQVLRLRAEKPDLSSGGMAEELSTLLGKSVSADWVRQNLRRARERFADILLDELAASLEDPTRERLEQELIDLQLLSYCQAALQNWKPLG
jgi:RNA polymerase sigma-70 factor (ECF subfamily)